MLRWPAVIEGQELSTYLSTRLTGRVTFADHPPEIPNMGWSTQWFDSPYYGLLYGHRDDTEAHAWVDTILGRWRLPAGSSVLDMACGRGRHALWLAIAGMRITGIDLSKESIKEARVRVPEGSFLVHDMHEPLGGTHFDAAICLFTSIGYSNSETDDQQVFHSAFANIRPGGRFVLDHMNTQHVLANLVPKENRLIEGVDFHIVRELDGDILVKRIEVTDAGVRSSFEERVRTLTPARLESMALNAGFLVEDITGGPDPRPFDPHVADRFVIWMHKPEA